MKMNKYLSRLTSSARGETFNPLTYPFLAATFAYGLGFVFFGTSAGVQDSSLHVAMLSLGASIPALWGAIALGTIILGLVYLLFHKPPAGRSSGLLGFMLWVFAGGCWLVTGGWLLFFAIALPNIYFWIWQYLSLSKFWHEDRRDIATMKAYDSGKYDVAIGGKALRLNNRGVDKQ
jgi:hypothetical protein